MTINIPPRWALGTVNVTNGSRTVTGVNTQWAQLVRGVLVPNIVAGQDGFQVVDGTRRIRIESLTSAGNGSNETITLEEPFPGATASGVAYSILRLGINPEYEGASAIEGLTLPRTYVGPTVTLAGSATLDLSSTAASTAYIVEVTGNPTIGAILIAPQTRKLVRCATGATFTHTAGAQEVQGGASQTFAANDLVEVSRENGTLVRVRAYSITASPPYSGPAITTAGRLPRFANAAGAIEMTSSFFEDIATGRAGVGTTSPARAWHVASATSDTAVRIENSSGSVDLRLFGASLFIDQNINLGEIIFRFGPTYGQTLALNATTVRPGADNAFDLGSASFRWRDGYFARNVGIGVTPSAALHVAGNVRFDGNYESSVSPFFYSWDGASSGSVRSGFRIDGAGQTLQFFTGTNERWRILTGGTLRPASGGALDLGEAGTRVRDIYTTNAVNVSSDDRLKDQFEELDRDAVRTFVRALRPLWYVMKRGRVEIVEEEVPGEFEEVQATEEFEVSQNRVEMVDGRAVLRTVTRTETLPVFVDVPVYDEAGQPVMIDVPEERDEEGNVTRPASALPRMHSAPRMVQRPKKRLVEVVTPGTRYHLGFRADEVYVAIEAAGWDPDFVASWGRNDRGDVSSLQWLRYDHFHAIWCAAIQALMDDNAALEARLAALEAA